MGMETYLEELGEKTAILEKLLAGYNDGRRKSFFCLAVNLLELSDCQEMCIRDSCYSYQEQWQPKGFPVVFRLYQLNLDGRGDWVYRGYWERHPMHFKEEL